MSALGSRYGLLEFRYVVETCRILTTQEGPHLAVGGAIVEA